MLVGLWGRRKGHNFFIGFAVTWFLTAVGGVIVVLLLRDKRTGRRGF